MDNLKSKLDGVVIRMLNADEFSREDLVAIFEKHKSFIPNPLISNIQVAEVNGKIVGIAVLQPQYHAEPIYVDEEYRNTMVHKDLVESLLRPLVHIKGLKVWIFAPDSKIAKLAARFDFKQKDYEVFERQF